MKKIELFIAPVLAAILLEGCNATKTDTMLHVVVWIVVLGGGVYLGLMFGNHVERIVSVNEIRAARGLEPIQESDRVVTQGHAWTITAPPQPETPTIELDPKRQIKVETD